MAADAIGGNDVKETSHVYRIYEFESIFDNGNVM